MISVLIPVYNVENYLQRCIDSVLAQDFQDWEMILVDDGSPDRCPEICDEAAKKDNRVTVVHKENGGLPSARLAAFERAKGEYLVFLDSDDWLLEGALTTLYEAVMSDGGWDIVKTRVLRIDDRGNEWNESYAIEEGTIEGDGKYLRSLQIDSISPYLHSAIYKATLFSKDCFSVLVEHGISVGEDWFTNYCVAPKVKRVKFIETATFAYFINSNSYMGGSIYGWKYYDRVEKAKCAINRMNHIEEDRLYKCGKALADLRYFFFYEVPFSWSHFYKIQPWALIAIDIMEKERVRFSYNSKHIKFINHPWTYWLYTHVYRYLFYIVKMRCKSRKVIE